MVTWVRRFLWGVGLCVLYTHVLAPTFNPGAGPGNIDATKDIAVASTLYTFSDGNYARGEVYFSRGFIIPANAKVRLGLTTTLLAFPGYQIPARTLYDVYATATVVLEKPLVFQTGWIALRGTFQGSKQSGGRAILSGSGFYLADNVFFPGTTIDGQPVEAMAELRVRGGPLTTVNNVYYSSTAVPSKYAIYLGDPNQAGSLTIRNAVFAYSDAPTLTWPVFKYEGHPNIQALYASGASSLHWYDSTISIMEQLTLRDMDVYFHGNCSIQNATPFDPVPALYNRRPSALKTYPGGASMARFIVDGTNPGSNHTVFLTGPSSLTVGPDVDMRIGSLGLRQESVGAQNRRTVYPFGSIMGQAEPLIMSYDCSLNLIDSSITCSLPCTLEGGARLVVQGTSDLYATSTYAGNRIFTAGRYAQNASGFFPMDSLLDIQINSKLNVHNTVLRNNNNP